MSSYGIIKVQGFWSCTDLGSNSSSTTYSDETVYSLVEESRQ